MRPPRPTIIAIGFSLWLAAVFGAFFGLQTYAAKPGSTHEPDDSGKAWMAQHRRPGHSLIVMAVHPECSCTRASLAELGDLLARARGRCDAVLLEVPCPEDAAPTSPRTLGGRDVSIVVDHGGAIATSLGAATSGHIVFMDTNGNIAFRGGITIARAHRGLSPAQTAMLESLDGRRPELCGAPVYGCALFDDDTSASPL